jgi:GxxExxY protein
MTNNATRNTIHLLSREIIGAAIEVHKEIGPSALESVYELCLCEEFRLRGIGFEKQKPIPLRYKHIAISKSLRCDIVVENLIICELKTVEHILPVHEAQIISYLRLSGLPKGLILNFNSARMANGIKAYVGHSFAQLSDL